MQKLEILEICIVVKNKHNLEDVQGLFKSVHSVLVKLVKDLFLALKLLAKRHTRGTGLRLRSCRLTTPFTMLMARSTWLIPKLCAIYTHFTHVHEPGRPLIRCTR